MVTFIATTPFQPVVISYLASLQIAMTQPFRLGDLLIVDGDTGTVVELTAFYIVLRRFDERRVIIPVQRFWTASYKNLTRNEETRLSDGVDMVMDWTAPIDDVRTAFLSLVATIPEWDRRAASMTVGCCKKRMY